EGGTAGARGSGKDPPSPGRKRRRKQWAPGARGGGKARAREPRHDLAQDGGVIFRLGLSRRTLDAEPRETLAQPRQRPFVQETREVVRTVRQQFPAAEPDEEIEILALNALRRGPARRLRELHLRNNERSRIAAQTGEAIEQGLIGRARQCERKQRIFLGAGGVNLVDIVAGSFAEQIGSKHIAAPPGHRLDREDT